MFFVLLPQLEVIIWKSKFSNLSLYKIRRAFMEIWENLFWFWNSVPHRRLISRAFNHLLMHYSSYDGFVSIKYTFLCEKTIFFVWDSILKHNARNQAEIFLIFFLTLISFFSLIVYLVRFNTNTKRHFLTMLTCVFNFTFLSFNLSMFTEEDGTTINNNDRKEC